MNDTESVMEELIPGYTVLAASMRAENDKAMQIASLLLRDDGTIYADKTRWRQLDRESRKHSKTVAKMRSQIDMLIQKAVEKGKLKR